MKPEEKSRWRPSPALAISILALFVALSGTALALQRNSVGPRELKRDAVRSPHIKNGKVKARDLATKARFPKVVVRRTLETGMGGFTAEAHCASGEVLTGGGAADASNWPLFASQPFPQLTGQMPDSWRARANAPASATHELRVWAICAQP